MKQSVAEFIIITEAVLFMLTTHTFMSGVVALYMIKPTYMYHKQQSPSVSDNNVTEKKTSENVRANCTNHPKPIKSKHLPFRLARQVKQ